MTGKITRIVREKAFGFIAGEDAKDYFFHRSAVQPTEDWDMRTRLPALTPLGCDQGRWCVGGRPFSSDRAGAPRRR
jgi:hypothetical protein